MSMTDYLVGMLAGEMPASFAEEALKAQAVAGRSYTLYRMAHPNPAHPDAAVCDDPFCCAAWKDEQSLRQLWSSSYSTYMEKIRAAVRDTDGQYLCYEDEPIQAVFHSSSAGYTEDSAAIWTPIPYLVSVSSPETAAEVPNYVTTVELTAADFKAGVLALQPDAALEGPPEGWLGEVKRDASGRVETVAVGGAEISGTSLRGGFFPALRLLYAGICAGALSVHRHRLRTRRGHEPVRRQRHGQGGGGLSGDPGALLPGHGPADRLILPFYEERLAE